MNIIETNNMTILKCNEGKTLTKFNNNFNNTLSSAIPFENDTEENIIDLNNVYSVTSSFISNPISKKLVFEFDLLESKSVFMSIMGINTSNKSKFIFPILVNKRKVFISAKHNNYNYDEFPIVESYSEIVKYPSRVDLVEGTNRIEIPYQSEYLWYDSIIFRDTIQEDKSNNKGISIYPNIDDLYFIESIEDFNNINYHNSSFNNIKSYSLENILFNISDENFNVDDNKLNYTISLDVDGNNIINEMVESLFTPKIVLICENVIDCSRYINLTPCIIDGYTNETFSSYLAEYKKINELRKLTELSIEYDLGEDYANRYLNMKGINLINKIRIMKLLNII